MALLITVAHDSELHTHITFERNVRMSNKLLQYMTELGSHKWASQLVGLFSKSRASRLIIPYFIKKYRVQTEEAEKNWKEYRSLNTFFTRRLKPGARSLHNDVDSLISPVDGTVTWAGTFEEGTLLNVKGQNYSIADLLQNDHRLQKYVHGYAYVLYLGPRDYHRIHAPVTGHLVQSDHLPGRVYPVNDFGLTHMRSVLSRNERLISYVAHRSGEIALIKVGAMNVSSIRYTDLTRHEWNKGDELAYFEFGSTVVLVMENDTFRPSPTIAVGQSIQMGECLGWIHPRHDAL